MKVNPRVAVPAGAAALLAAVAIGAVVAGGSDDEETPTTTSSTSTTVLVTADLADLIEASGFGDPATIEIPPVADASTLAWLEGEGTPAVALVTATERLWAEGSPACEEVAEALDALGTPEDIAGAAAETPDGPTQEILLGLHTATGTALSACQDPAAFETARAELGWQWALTDRRLTEIGIEG